MMTFLVIFTYLHLIWLKERDDFRLKSLDLHSRKLTKHLKIGLLKRKVVSQPQFFRGYLSFREEFLRPFCFPNLSHFRIIFAKRGFGIPSRKDHKRITNPLSGSLNITSVENRLQPLFYGLGLTSMFLKVNDSIFHFYRAHSSNSVGPQLRCAWIPNKLSAVLSTGHLYHSRSTKLNPGETN